MGNRWHTLALRLLRRVYGMLCRPAYCIISRVRPDDSLVLFALHLGTNILSQSMPSTQKAYSTKSVLNGKLCDPAGNYVVPVRLGSCRSGPQFGGVVDRKSYGLEFLPQPRHITVCRRSKPHGESVIGSVISGLKA